MRISWVTVVLCLSASLATLAGDLPPGSQMAVAIERNDLEKVKELVEEHGVELRIEYSAENSVSPLAKACWDGREEIVRYLLEKGANVNVTTSDGTTPLLEAVRRERPVIVGMLLAKGAKPNQRDSRQMTPLGTAAGVGSVEVIELLVKAKADLHAEMYGITPLGFAVAAKKTEAIKRLVALGANVNHVSKLSGQTALHGAILQGGDPKMIELLLSLKANPNARAKDGATPLKMAKDAEMEDIIPILKKAGAK